MLKHFFLRYNLQNKPSTVILLTRLKFEFLWEVEPAPQNTPLFTIIVVLLFYHMIMHRTFTRTDIYVKCLYNLIKTVNCDKNLQHKIVIVIKIFV